MARQRDYKAEYRRRKQLESERRAHRREIQRRYRRRLKQAKQAGFQSVREWERWRSQQSDQIYEARQVDQLDELLGKRRRGSKLPNAGEIARYLGSLGQSPRAFFKAWYA